MKEAVRLPFQCNPIHLTTGMVKALLQNGQKEVVPLFRSEGFLRQGFSIVIPPRRGKPVDGFHLLNVSFLLLHHSRVMAKRNGAEPVIADTRSMERIPVSGFGFFQVNLARRRWSPSFAT
jgi:hypothetical protein